jgi:hypothetical protein
MLMSRRRRCMNPQPPENPVPEHRFREYEDPHYHDDPEPIPSDEQGAAKKPPPRRKPIPKYPKRRSIEEEG